MAVCGYTPILPPPTPNDGSPASRAIGILDPLDEQISTRVGAALMFNHPPQAAYVLQNITPSTGAKAVANIKTVLDRITVLERGDREGGEGDLAAMATLEDRGFTPEYRAQLSDLVNQATGADPAPAIVSISPEELEAAQLSLYAWYKEWSMVAHTMIRRRDWLISLGLARRKAASSADEPSDDLDDETVPVVP
jgi:hypothetical protein